MHTHARTRTHHGPCTCACTSGSLSREGWVHLKQHTTAAHQRAIARVPCRVVPCRATRRTNLLGVAGLPLASNTCFPIRDTAVWSDRHIFPVRWIRGHALRPWLGVYRRPILPCATSKTKQFKCGCQHRQRGVACMRGAAKRVGHPLQPPCVCPCARVCPCVSLCPWAVCTRVCARVPPCAASCAPAGLGIPWHMS